MSNSLSVVMTLEVGGRLESQGTGVCIDIKQCRISTAGDAIGEGILLIHIGGGDGGDRGLVFLDADGGVIPAAVGGDDRCGVLNHCCRWIGGHAMIVAQSVRVAHGHGDG